MTARRSAESRSCCTHPHQPPELPLTQSAAFAQLHRQPQIRRWRDGNIPDVSEAVASPRRLTDDQNRARRVLELAPLVPTPVWGRDDLETGDMWNSNSVISWLIVRSGIDIESIQPPAGGRAPGWRAGVVVARRQELEAARVSGVRADQPVLVRPRTAP